MARDSLNPDLNDTSCTVTDCLEVADTIAAAAVTIPALVGAPADQSTFVLDLPLCAEHQHLLRMGVTSCTLTT